MKRIMLTGLVSMVGLAIVASTPVFADSCGSKCTGILPQSWCEGSGAGIIEILGLILNILTAGVGVLMVVGIVISAVQWLSARDNEEQVRKSRRRIVNIIIGAVMWALMWAALNWLIPGFSTDIRLPGTVSSGDEECYFDAGGVGSGDIDHVGSTTGDKNGTGTNSQRSSFPIGDPTETSVNIPCDDRTVDVGVWDAWDNGKKTRHRLCSIPNMYRKQEGKKAHLKEPTEDIVVEAGRPDLQYTILVNSRVSGAWYSMIEAAKKDGVTLKARSSFRTMERQFGIRGNNRCYSAAEKAKILKMAAAWKEGDRPIPKMKSKKCPYGAAPGWSPHQNGIAVDMSKYYDDGKGRCGSAMTHCTNKKDPLYKWMTENSTRFGIAQLHGEFWHYDSKCPYRNWGKRKPTFCGGKYNGEDV